MWYEYTNRRRILPILYNLHNVNTQSEEEFYTIYIMWYEYTNIHQKKKKNFIHFIHTQIYTEYKLMYQNKLYKNVLL